MELYELTDIQAGWHIRIQGRFRDRSVLVGQVTQLMNEKCFRLGTGDTSLVVSYEQIDQLEVLDTSEELIGERVDVE